MATTTSAVKGNAHRRGRADICGGGLMYVTAQLQAAMSIIDQTHGRVDTELPKHLIVLGSLWTQCAWEKKKSYLYFDVMQR